MNLETRFSRKPPRLPCPDAGVTGCNYLRGGAQMRYKGPMAGKVK